MFQLVQAAIVALLVIAGGVLFFWQTLLPVFSPETRKARMEAAVLKVMREELSQPTIEASIELTEASQGQWHGTATVGESKFNVHVERTAVGIQVRFRRSN
jgi:hypothetical protein